MQIQSVHAGMDMHMTEKKMCSTHKHGQIHRFFQPPSHIVNRCLEIPCSVMTSGRLQHNSECAMKAFKDADLTLLEITNFTTFHHKNRADFLSESLNQHTTTVIKIEISDTVEENISQVNI